MGFNASLGKLPIVDGIRWREMDVADDGSFVRRFGSEPYIVCRGRESVVYR